MNSLVNASEARIIELDGVRGFAALLVVYVHVLIRWVPSSPEVVFWLRTFSSLSWTGVYLFFVLSGFLIGRILIKNRSSVNYFKTFYIRRALRILPLYFLLLCVLGILKSLLSESYAHHFETGIIPGWSYLFLVQNIYMATSGEWGASLLAVTWSVAVEEQFYLFLPWLIYLVKPVKLPGVLLGILVCAPVIRWMLPFPAPGFLLLGVLETLAGGNLIALIYDKHTHLFKKYALSVCAVCLLIISGFAMILKFIGINYGAFYYTWISLFWLSFFWLVLAFLNTSWTVVFRSRFLCLIGSVSYGVYLLHVPVNLFLFQYVENSKGFEFRDENGLWIAVAGILITLFLSFVSYHSFEKILILAGKKLKYS